MQMPSASSRGYRPGREEPKAQSGSIRWYSSLSSRAFVKKTNKEASSGLLKTAGLQPRHKDTKRHEDVNKCVHCLSAALCLRAFVAFPVFQASC